MPSHRKKAIKTRLADAIGYLNLTTADVESDLAAINTVKECEAKIIPTARLTQIREKLQKKNSEALAEYRQLMHMMLDRFMNVALINEVSLMFYGFWRAAITNEAERTALRIKEENLCKSLIGAFNELEQCERENFQLQQRIASARAAWRIFLTG